jgi:hypothetical protein
LETASATQPGAETSARPDVSASTTETSAPSVHDRLKAHLAPPEPAKETRAPESEPVAEAEETEAVEAQEPATEAAEEEQTEEEIRIESIKDLAEQTGLELDKLMDLDIPTKIDGKEGKARLRDMIKSFQLESHLNNKLMAFADEKKAHETEKQTFMQQRMEKIKNLDMAGNVAMRLLDGEYAQVNWQELQATDPNAFNAKVLDYQQRQQAIKYVMDQVSEERAKADETAKAQKAAYLDEQSKLLDSKLPEWADKAKREKDVAEMATTLQDAYGITKEELFRVDDHRQLLIARDAWKWQQLQKAKPAIMNKVKTAPKLLKPGTPQSKASQDGLRLQQDRTRLKSTGKVADAKPVLKKLLFG